jgi:Ca-activated chloride channel family protein
MMTLDFPWALLLTPLPLIIWLLQKPKAAEVTTIRTPLFGYWQSMQTQTTEYQTNRLNKLISLLIWGCLVIAVSRPQWVGEAVELPASGRDLLLSIDISESMYEEDLTLNNDPATRLDVVKSVLTDFIKKREGDRIGLVLFADQAYLQTPLTFDLKTVQYMLDETEIGLAGKATAIGDGIGLSVKRLRERPEQNRVLILLSDGESNRGEDPIEAAKLAKQAGVKIYTVGIGADTALRRTLFGTRRINPSAGLDEKTLKKIAEMTGGRYFRAKSTKDLQKVYALLDSLEPVEDEPEIYRPINDLYYYPALLALVLVCLSLFIKSSFIARIKNWGARSTDKQAEASLNPSMESRYVDR